LSDAFTAVEFPVLTSAASSPAAEAAGRAAGYAAGRREAEAELGLLREQALADAAASREAARGEIEAARVLLGAAADALADRAVPLVDALDAALLASAVEIAEAILQRELADETVAALDAARRATGAADRAELRRIRLHPDDLRLVRELGELPVPAVADPSLARGDAVADLDDGWFDARLGAAVARVRAALAGGAG
jgi:flagellar assembly protein FliH